MQQEPLKLIVAGPVGAGKTTFIANLSEVELVNTDVVASESIGKLRTTVALDFGVLTLNGVTLHIYGTPGQDRYDFMWEILCQGALGLLLLVAGDQPETFVQARNIFDFITSRIAVPYLIGVTRADLPTAWASDEVADFFDVGYDQVINFNANQKSGCLFAVETILQTVVND